MSILDYFARSVDSSALPDPDGNLSDRIPRRAILSANQEVAKVLIPGPRHPKRHGKYNAYSWEIGRTASRIGAKSTAV